MLILVLCQVGWLKEGLLYCKKIKAKVILQVTMTYNLFAINVEVIVGCNYRSDLWTFGSTEVVLRRTGRIQEKI